MIRIDSDSHFTPLDAFDDLDPKYAEIGPHFELLPSGRYKVIHKARDRLIWIRRQESTPWPKMDLTCRC